MIKPGCIVGAGLSGLLAAAAWPQCRILEAASGPREEHKALLRFRSDAVSRLTGIPFRQVMVRKGIWSDGEFRTPTIALANEYAHKVTGRYVGDRSIWTAADQQPVTRYIAPETFYDQLVEAAFDRIEWGVDAFECKLPKQGACISTAPLPVAIHACQLPPVNLDRASIDVFRFRIPGADLFQTIYFPDESTRLYRSSMTGDLLIAECMSSATMPRNGLLQQEGALLNKAFGRIMIAARPMDHAIQKYGKIIELPDEVRKSIMFKLTHDHGIYSLGRFATWRNILLDDVINDIAVIKRLMNTDDTKYDLAKARAA